MSKQNIVLYQRVPVSPENVAGLRPLFSISEGDDAFANAPAIVAAKSQAAYRAADASGAPLPVLVVVGERRTADETGKIIKAEYMPLDAALKPLADAPFGTLAEVK